MRVLKNILIIWFDFKEQNSIVHFCVCESFSLRPISLCFSTFIVIGHSSNLIEVQMFRFDNISTLWVAVFIAKAYLIRLWLIKRYTNIHSGCYKRIRHVKQREWYVGLTWYPLLHSPGTPWIITTFRVT